MEFRKYTFNTKDTVGNDIGSFHVTFPTFTPEEHEQFINEYNTLYANLGDKRVIIGESSPGSLTELGAWLLNKWKLKYYSAPLLTPVASDFNRDWFNTITGIFSQLYVYSDKVSNYPITETTSTWIRRKFVMYNNQGERNDQFNTYAQNSDRFRAQNMSLYENFYAPAYGSGTGGNSAGAMTIDIRIYYLVTDGTYGIINIYGYYGQGYDGARLDSLYPAGSPAALIERWIPALIVNNQDYEETDPTDLDPYRPGGYSGTGGGTGTFSETGDIVGIPSLPTLSAVDTGFITLFNPSAAQVKALANYMWSDDFSLDTFKNIVANPMECILGLAIVPVDPPNAGSKNVAVGNIQTSVSLPYLSSQYVEVDCGTLNVQEFWGSYLDYSPYTKMSLYLPYIGIVPLDIDDVMNATITIKYHVDVLSGACVAYVLCNGTQLYTYIGQCSSNVPVTSNDFTNTVNGILGIAGNIGSLAASGGSVGNMISTAASMASNAINAIKPNIQKSGAMSGTGGLMGVQTPYLICQRPRQSVPASQNAFTGYPSNITAKLGDLSGYTTVESIHLDGLTCTDAELSEIMELLESGVII